MTYAELDQRTDALAPAPLFNAALKGQKCLIDDHIGVAGLILSILVVHPLVGAGTILRDCKGFSGHLGYFRGRRGHIGIVH